MKVLLATGYEEFDRCICEVIEQRPSLNIEVTGEIYYRGAIREYKNDYDVIVISEDLPGEEEFTTDTLCTLREMGKRVIFIVGDRNDEDTKTKVTTCMSLGIYDFIYNDESINVVLDHILNPATLKMRDSNLKNLQNQFQAIQEEKKKLPVGQDDEIEQILEEKDYLQDENDEDTSFDDYEQNKIPKIKFKNPLKGVGEKLNNISADVNSFKVTFQNKFGNTLNQIQASKQSLQQLTAKKQPAIKTNEPYKMVLAVWNPLRTFKDFTALNLAITLKASLINLDFTCPVLDTWFDIKQTTLEDVSKEDAGILTLAERFQPEFITKMMREIKWGIRYLPAGNKMGNIGIPDFGDNAVNFFENILSKANEEAPILVVSVGGSYETPYTYATLKEADVIVIPTNGLPQEQTVISQQIDELTRIGLGEKYLALTFCGEESNRDVFAKQIALNISYNEYAESCKAYNPHCLINNEWQKVAEYLSTFMLQLRKELA